MVLTAKLSSKVVVGDKVILARPDEGEQHESPGWHPWLDRLAGTVLTVRDVAGHLVLVHETALPLRGDWLVRL